jgi:predicted dehydrogenase
MASRLGLGVIGLGRRWNRYRRALEDLEDQVVVRVVCDPSLRRAEQEAQQMGCAAAGGVLDLVEHPAVQAVLLLDPGWQALWPLEQVCRAGKPVLCAAAVELEPERIVALEEAFPPPPAGPLVRFVLSAPLERMVEALVELRERSLGALQLVRIGWTAAETQSGRRVLETPGILPLLRACAILFQEPPEALPAPDFLAASTIPDQPGFASLVLGFPGGRVGQLTLWRSDTLPRACHLELIGENGTAQADLPEEVRWLDTEGTSTRRLPGGLSEVQALRHFLAALESRQPAGPGLADVCELLGWLRRVQLGTEPRRLP